MDKRDFARSIKEYLGLNDFKVVGVNGGAISLVRENEEIQISYRKYPGIYVFRDTNLCFKTFNEVENILKKYYKKYKIELQNYTIYHSSRRFEKIGEIDIASPEDIEKVLPMLRTMVYEDILPFFERYNSLVEVHKQLTSFGNDFDQINKFLFQPQPIRRMIIKRLFNDSDWNEYAQNLTNHILIKVKQDPAPEYELYAKILPDLYEELKLTQPLNV